MTDQVINNDEVQHQQGADSTQGKNKRSFDSGFKRNMSIIGITAVVALVVIVAAIWTAKSKADAGNSKIDKTAIAAGQGSFGTSTTAPTPSEEERLKRVQGKESDKAKESNDTYIPKDNPLNVEKFKAPETQNNGSGAGYNYAAGNNQGNQGDPQRDGNIRKGIEAQLNAILARAEPPPPQVAAPYANPLGPNTATAAAANASTVASAGSPATQDSLITGLSIAGARLVSPYDSDKTSYISAEITAGPLTGAFVTGVGTLNANEGVAMRFTRMKFQGENYAIDATALDSKTSSDAMSADIDRKLLSRYVLPLAFVSAQAYMTALSKPSQAIQAIATLGGAGATTPVATTPAATTLQATASAASAGLGQAIEKLGTQTPAAYIPIDTSIALLFNVTVLKKAGK
jgi:hypothetical protein